MNEAETVYASIPGGSNLIAWFGQVPDFHNAEIVSFGLRRRAPSMLVLHAWNVTSEADDRGHFVLDKHAVVTFALEDIIDLQLNGFSHQNVILGLQLEPNSGLNGIIRCRRVLVDFVAGNPDDARGWLMATRRVRE
jgi:hypothetical protein